MIEMEAERSEVEMGGRQSRWWRFGTTGTAATEIREDGCGDIGDTVRVTEDMQDDGDSGFGRNRS